MRILHLSTSDIDGGAARAAYRLHQHLGTVVDSQMLVRARFSSDPTVIAETTLLTKAGPRMSELPLNLYPQRDPGMFSLQWFPDTLQSKIAQLNPDILNLHWLGTGFLQIETLARCKMPIVWTMHDMWALTGGCHYDQGCDRYTQSCGRCPMLKSDREWDLSRWTFQRKAKAWKELNLTVVTPSQWLAQCAKSSALFQQLPIKVIPNGIDTQQYQPIPKPLARERLHLPQDKSLVLFSAMTPDDPRKGFDLLRQALEQLAATEWRDQLELLVLGTSTPIQALTSGLKAHYLGQLSGEEKLALVYSAADVFTAPSTQDNLPNTVLEAIACGTPAVAFNIGGMPDMIEHQQNGYLAQPFDTADFAQGITWCLEHSERHRQLCDRAREKAEQEFISELQAQRYLALYQEMIQG